MIRSLAALIACTAFLLVRADAQVRPIYDTGAAGLVQLLQRLQTTASVLHTGAHPDDEDSAFLARAARGDHARVAYLSLNRGEGGQNIIGNELFDAIPIHQYVKVAGRWLERNAPQEGLQAAAGLIADQLNRASDRLPGEEKSQLADLDERAGRQALATAAHASALGYFQEGLRLLPSEPWRGELHALWFRLLRGAAECAGLTGDHALSERRAGQAEREYDSNGSSHATESTVGPPRTSPGDRVRELTAWRYTDSSAHRGLVIFNLNRPIGCAVDEVVYSRARSRAFGQLIWSHPMNTMSMHMSRIVTLLGALAVCSMAHADARPTRVYTLTPSTHGNPEGNSGDLWTALLNSASLQAGVVGTRIPEPGTFAQVATMALWVVANLRLFRRGRTV